MPALSAVNFTSLLLPPYDLFDAERRDLVPVLILVTVDQLQHDAVAFFGEQGGWLPDLDVLGRHDVDHRQGDLSRRTAGGHAHDQSQRQPESPQSHPPLMKSALVFWLASGDARS